MTDIEGQKMRVVVSLLALHFVTVSLLTFCFRRAALQIDVSHFQLCDRGSSVSQSQMKKHECKQIVISCSIIL